MEWSQTWSQTLGGLSARSGSQRAGSCSHLLLGHFAKIEKQLRSFAV